MNKWKTAFFMLATVVLLTFIIIAYFIFSPTENVKLVDEGNETVKSSILRVQTTTNEFEAIAKKYLAEAIKDSPIDVQLEVDEQIYLFSDLIIFGVTIPIQMDFDPIVDDGNIRMKQTKVHIGKFNIPPSTVLKIVKDSVNFPSWIIVQPDEEEIYVDLSRLNIADGNRVRAKAINLDKDEILLEISSAKYSLNSPTDFIALQIALVILFLSNSTVSPFLLITFIFNSPL